MIDKSKCVIINAAYGGWYPKGSRRLKKSLLENGWKNILQWIDVPINEIFKHDCKYTIKAAAFKQAVSFGYTHILWLDCSMWAVQNPFPIFELIDRDGIYVESNGYNAAQECNDSSLKHFDISRDEAEKIPMCSSGFMGINIESDKGKEFYRLFVESARKGIFNGSREHDNQSKDPRFLHHRQDQSAASLIFHKIGYMPKPLGTHFSYLAGPEKTNQSEQTYFLCQGM